MIIKQPRVTYEEKLRKFFALIEEAKKKKSKIIYYSVDQEARVNNFINDIKIINDFDLDVKVELEKMQLIFNNKSVIEYKILKEG